MGLWQRSVLVLGAAGGAALLAARGLAWFEPAWTPLPAPPAANGDAVAEVEAEEPIVALAGPSLTVQHGAAAAPPVERVRRCGGGDALVTIERPGDEATFVVVRREGRVCFRVGYPDDDGMPAALRVHGTVDAAGAAGPIAVVHTRPTDGESGSARHEEVQLSVISLAGRLLLDRALESHAPYFGPAGSELSVIPAIWEDGTLVVWSSARSWHGSIGQCTGSLLRLQRVGPVSVAEGLPCQPTGIVDVDGDGAVELTGETSPQDGAPWLAVITPTGDFVATWSGDGHARILGSAEPALLVAPESPLAGSLLVPWPWNDGGTELPPDDGLRLVHDWDGDGADEVVVARFGESVVLDAAGRRRTALDGEPITGRVDGDVRELVVTSRRCGVAAIDRWGAERCAPGDLQQLARVLTAGRSFDWTGDGTADVTAIGTAADGTLWLAAWAEGDLTFSLQAGALEELPPRHQAPRTLNLSGTGGSEVLLATPDGFAVRSVPDGAVRWTGRAEDGVLDAWAFPAAGASAIAVR